MNHYVTVQIINAFCFIVSWYIYLFTMINTRQLMISSSGTQRWEKSDWKSFRNNLDVWWITRGSFNWLFMIQICLILCKLWEHHRQSPLSSNSVLETRRFISKLILGIESLVNVFVLQYTKTCIIAWLQ